MQKNIKILMIDDDEEDFMIVRDVVGNIEHDKYEIEHAPSFEEGIKAINKGMHDIYLVDYHLGAETGLDLIQKVINNGCKTPLILLTGQNNIEIDMKAMKAGASDYLVKDKISSQTLESSIRYSIAHAKHLKEIKELNSELEKRVEDRTLMLRETVYELEKSRKEISEALAKEKELNDLKSRFVTMASHEFRTPLSTILSSASLIEKYDTPETEDKRLKHIDRIKSSVNHLTAILSDLLSLAKLEEGVLQNNPVAFDIVAFSEGLIQDMLGLTKEGQTICYKHEGTNKLVTLDIKFLKQILTNLLANAIKFSNEGTQIDLSTKTDDIELTITIQDRGVGIDEKDQKHLFERFFRAQNVENIPGTGLGLSIISKYLELMKGSITFTSKLNEGTTFTTRFPLK
jgi:signal transduction histidine kinase